MLLVCELHLVQAAGPGASQELRERAGSSGKIRRAAPGAIGGVSEAARSVPGVQRFRREPRLIRLWLVRRAPLAPAAEAEQAESIVSEREAAAKFNALRPGLSMGCLKPLEACQGCSASEESQGAFDCGSSASSIGAGGRS